MTSNDHRGRNYLVAILFAVFFPPLLIVLHEAAHYTAARLLGYIPTFSYAGVSIFQALEPAHDYVVTLAGPCVEALFCVVGVVGLTRWRRSPRLGTGVEVWLWSALAGAGL